MGSIQAMEAFLRRIFTADSLEDAFQSGIPGKKPRSPLKCSKALMVFRNGKWEQLVAVTCRSDTFPPTTSGAEWRETQASTKHLREYRNYGFVQGTYSFHTSSRSGKFGLLGSLQSQRYDYAWCIRTKRAKLLSAIYFRQNYRYETFRLLISTVYASNSTLCSENLSRM